MAHRLHCSPSLQWLFLPLTGGGMVLIHIKQAQKTGMGIVVVLAARLHCQILALEESPLTLEESNSLQQKEEFSKQKKNPIASNRKKARIQHPRNRKEEESQVPGTRKHLHVSPPALPFSEYGGESLQPR